jgi:hypothetical protein
MASSFWSHVRQLQLPHLHNLLQVYWHLSHPAGVRKSLGSASKLKGALVPNLPGKYGVQAESGTKVPGTSRSNASRTDLNLRYEPSESVILFALYKSIECSESLLGFHAPKIPRTEKEV